MKIRKKLTLVKPNRLLKMNFYPILLLLISISFNGFSQNGDSSKTKYFSIGIGIPYFNFRDNVSSSLSYQGIGLGELKIQKASHGKSVKQFEITLGIGSASPEIENKTDWNEPAAIIYYDIAYAYLREIVNNRKLKMYLGGRVSSNMQNVIYPTINNVLAYNINWISVQPSSILSYTVNLGNKKSLISYQLSIPVFGLNTRPLNYNGIIPVESVWNQNENSPSTFWQQKKTTSIHNNLTVQSSIAWDIPMKKNKFRLGYTWLYQNNTVSVNSLTSVKSSLSLSYLIVSKKHKK